MSKQIKDRIKELVTNNATIMLNHRYVRDDELYREKVVLLTGDYRGIGLATGKRFLQQGARVILAGKCIDEIGDFQNSDCHVIQWDIANSVERSEKFDCCLNVFGKIDIWINCVEYINPAKPEADFFNTTEKEWDSQMSINCKELFFMVQLIGRYFFENRIAGHIVQILNVGQINNSWAPGGIAKRASGEFMRGIAKTLAPYHIVMNGIVSAYEHPGVAKEQSKHITELTDDYAMYGCEIADIVSFLASDMADHMVGNMVICEKGMSFIS